MSNTIYNKITINNDTLIDLSQDTVTSAAHIVNGYVGHLADGTQVTGTGGEATLQSKTVSPTESSQTVTPDSGYDGLSSVSVNAISSSYVGTGVTRRSTSDLTASGATVTAPAGYYAEAATKTVASGTAGTPTATKGTVSNHSVTVTPSVTNTAGYISGSTKTGTAVTVSASELVSGNKEITSNGTNIDVADYSTVSVSVASGGGTHNLPSGYTEYEYIEATGTQYINTGYIPVATTEVHATIERTAVQSYSAVDWGVTPAPKAITAGVYWSWGSATDKNNQAYNPDIPFGPLTVRVNRNGVYNLLGNLAVNFGTVTWTSGQLPIFLFARNNNGNVDRKSKLKIYYWAAYENGSKIVEFIPAMRNSDNVLGFYETVNGAFFTNAGDGAFTGGAF